jgi:hypothetical protein
MFPNQEKKGIAKFHKMLEQKHNTALANLLQNKDFRFYMAELLGVCKTFENAFDEKGNVAAFNNGKQAIGQKIFNDIMLISPQAYITMCQEEQEILSMRDQMGDK